MKRCPYCAEEIQDAAIKCKHCASMLDGNRQTAAGVPGARKLFRSRTDRMLSGVCGGLAAYAAMDPSLMRILVAVGIFATGIIPGIIAYIVAACIIPEED